MASPDAMAKLRAVLDYIPEEAARRLPGDPQEMYDAVTRRLHRTVAVKSQVKRKVIVEQPELAEDVEPEAPAWVPPMPPPAPEPAAMAEPMPAAPPPAMAAMPAAIAEASTIVEAREPAPEEEPAPPAEDFFDLGGAKGRDLAPVEPEINLSEAEWRHLERPQEIPVEEAEAPAVAGEPGAPGAGEDEAFEEIVLPGEGEAAAAHHAPAAPQQAQRAPRPTRLAQPPPQETAVAELPTQAEFEVEEEGEVSAPEEFEILGEEEVALGDGEEPAYQVNEFTLYRREVRTKSGRVKTNYFFSAEPAADAVPSPLPEDHEVMVNEATGIPVIRKSHTRSLPVIEIEGIGPVMAERLERSGIRTTRDLLRIDVREVSGETGISERLLGNFRAMANLLQLSGIYPDQAAALVHAGVRSLEDLNKANPQELAKAANRAAKDANLKLRGKMTASRIKGWQDNIYNLQPES